MEGSGSNFLLLHYFYRRSRCFHHASNCYHHRCESHSVPFLLLRPGSSLESRLCLSFLMYHSPVMLRNMTLPGSCESWSFEERQSHLPQYSSNYQSSSCFPALQSSSEAQPSPYLGVDRLQVGPPVVYSASVACSAGAGPVMQLRGLQPHCLFLYRSRVCANLNCVFCLTKTTILIVHQPSRFETRRPDSTE